MRHSLPRNLRSSTTLVHLVKKNLIHIKYKLRHEWGLAAVYLLWTLELLGMLYFFRFLSFSRGTGNPKQSFFDNLSNLFLSRNMPFRKHNPKNFVWINSSSSQLLHFMLLLIHSLYLCFSLGGGHPNSPLVCRCGF